MSESALDTVLKHDTAIVAAALITLTLLCWMAVLAGAGTGMDPAAMSGWLPMLDMPSALSGTWTPAYWAISFFMWATMMVAMMLPSASPTVLLYAGVVRQAERKGRIQNAGTSIASFAAGYLALWCGFSALAVVTQWGLEQSGAMTAMMHAQGGLLAGGLLIAAGLYQLTPLKSACLRHCRGPAQFIAAHWRPGAGGAWRMGLVHGAYCVGCCAVLMLLLFVGGVMNLIWILGLTLVVALEKLAPFGVRLGTFLGVVLLGAGVALIATAA